jgi:hypothetical protein
MTQIESGAPSSQTETPEPQKRAALEQNARNGANYFFWIAFFAIFNKVMDLLSSTRRFVFGLGAPLFIERAFPEGNPAFMWGIIVILAGVFVVIGVFARRGNLLVYVLGILLYLGDMLLSIRAGDAVGALVHVVFAVLLIMGFIATLKLKKLPSEKVKPKS